LSPCYYKRLDVIVVSRVTDPSIPFVIVCEITLSLASPLLFPEGEKKTRHRFTKSSLYAIIFSLLTQVISCWLEVLIPWFHIYLSELLYIGIVLVIVLLK